MIKFENVQIKYDDFIAIQNLNLEIEEGEFFTFLGPSGCGKTTTLRALAGFIIPSLGNIYINDKDVTHTAIEKRGVGMVFQSYALFPTMTVYDNIAFGLTVEKREKGYIKERVHELARMVDLQKEQLEKNVSNLSGGQQQRVAIARALAKKPEILVMDEPLSNLDAKLRKQLRTEIKEFQQEYDITTVYVTHDQEEALTLSDRIAIFNDGKIEQIGTPQEIYNASRTEFVCNFIGNANKLGNKTLQKLEETSENFTIDTSKKYYIRPEKINAVSQVGEDYHLKNNEVFATVIRKDFYGTHTYYICDIDGEQMRVFEQEDGRHIFQINEKLILTILENDLLIYGEEGE